MFVVHELVRRLVRVRRAGATVQHVDGVFDRVWPETDRSTGGNEVRSGILHDGADGTLGDAVEGVHVRWTCSLAYGFLVEEFLELVREKFARVVTVDGANDLDRVGFAGASVRVDRRHVLTHLGKGLAFSLEKVD